MATQCRRPDSVDTMRQATLRHRQDQTTPAVYGGPMYCSTVVDSGPPRATAQRVINELAAIRPDLATPTHTNMALLNNAALDLANYSGTALSNDAAKFAADEANYNGTSGSGTVDISHAGAVRADITALRRDCPRHG